MTAPKVCEHCGSALDANEICHCQEEAQSAAAMEFVMGDSLASLPKTIDFNFEELKGALAQSLAHYNGLVVTEDGIKSAKDDRAKLNKLREALETKRKEVKKECMAPYNDFEAKVKELVALIDRPIAAIDSQLKDYEEKRRSEKREAILAIYEENIGDLRSLLPFDKLWRDEWYNTGMSMKKIREAIVDSEEKVKSDLAVLSTVESEFAEAVKLKYLENLDLNIALAERARLQDQARRLREYEEQKANETRQEEPVRAPSPGPVQDAVQTPVNETVYRLCFECRVTAAQAQDLSTWLKAHNISYRRI